VSAGAPTAATLRVAVDATAVPARLTGAGVYTSRLLAALARRDDVDLDVFAARGSAALLAGPGLRLHQVAAARVLHGVHYELPLRGTGGLAQVVTVHDLTLVTHAEWHEPSKVWYFRRAMRHAVAAAERVLCVSAATARDATRHLGVPPERIDVTPLGTDLAPATEAAVHDLRDRLGLTGPYLLGLGTLEPRKDLPTLVRAFATLAGELPHTLVLAGLAGWGSGALAEAVAASGVADRVLLPGYVPEADKAALFTGADLFVYPSRYEGFGLPVLEAMACGVPVLTTTGGSLPEVAGDAALLVDPGEPDLLAGAMARLLGDPAARARLARRGRARAAAQTWERCAALTADAYRRAVAEQASRGRELRRQAP
jgi:glycosyltransferase involved in cell wall biosynthesis